MFVVTDVMISGAMNVLSVRRYQTEYAGVLMDRIGMTETVTHMPCALQDTVLYRGVCVDTYALLL